jgi:NTE family protein
MRAGVNVGLNILRTSDVRVGAYIGRTSATIKVGDPGFPELDGKETGAELLWRIDTQDNPVVPVAGVLAQLRLSQVFDAPDVAFQEQTFQSDAPLTQLSASANGFWSLGPRNRLFLAGSLGTSFDDDPLPTSEFELGGPFRLSAYHPGELRGNHAYTLTAGYLRRVFRLPDLIGGPVFAGGWVDNGDAFDDWSSATWRTNASLGLVVDRSSARPSLPARGLRRAVAALPPESDACSADPGGGGIMRPHRSWPTGRSPNGRAERSPFYSCRRS